MTPEQIKAIIDANIYTNHNGEVTADMVRQPLYALADNMRGTPIDAGLVAEDGLYFVDAYLNIGAQLTQDGFAAINFLTFREV